MDRNCAPARKTSPPYPDAPPPPQAVVFEATNHSFQIPNPHRVPRGSAAMRSRSPWYAMGQRLDYGAANAKCGNNWLNGGSGLLANPPVQPPASWPSRGVLRLNSSFDCRWRAGQDEARTFAPQHLVRADTGKAEPEASIRDLDLAAAAGPSCWSVRVATLSASGSSFAASLRV